ncbi:hypothetical protein GCM10010109_42140 [Actinoplanes campanulatus]|nr:hypothetical protein GCM10010109_42140 [Actinoplanes campanulatus]GID39375.1 hypothetical protein Aca09nite_58810 [Actinoplanes campanulatus]
MHPLHRTGPVTESSQDGRRISTRDQADIEAYRLLRGGGRGGYQAYQQE